MRRSRNRVYGILLTLVTGSMPFAAGHAQQSRPTAPAQLEPVPTPTINPKALKMPPPGSRNDAAAPNPDQTTSETPKLKAPSVNLGKYDLQLNAGKTSDVNPRTGLDSGETSNLSKITRGKSERVTPDYFGLKLTVPTHQ